MGKPSYSYSDARKRAREHDSFESFCIKAPEGVEFFKVEKEGVVRLDIIPFIAGKGNPHAEDGMLHYERTYFTHPRIGASERTVICPQRTLNLPCPICEHQRKLKADDSAEEDLIKSLYPKERQLFQVIDLDSKDQKIQLWDVSYHNFGRLLDERIDTMDEGDDIHLFYHLTKGYTLRIAFKEERFGKRTFFRASTIDFKKREPYKDSIIDEGHCLDDLLIVEPYEKLKSMFLQQDDGGGRGGRSERRDDRDDRREGGGRDRESERETRPAREESRGRDSERGAERRVREDTRGDTRRGRDEDRDGGGRDRDRDRGEREEERGDDRGGRDRDGGRSARDSDREKDEKPKDDDRRSDRRRDDDRDAPKASRRDEGWDEDRDPPKRETKPKDDDRDPPKDERRSSRRDSDDDRDPPKTEKEERRGSRRDDDDDRDPPKAEKDTRSSSSRRNDDWED